MPVAKAVKRVWTNKISPIARGCLIIMKVIPIDNIDNTKTVINKTKSSL